MLLTGALFLSFLTYLTLRGGLRAKRALRLGGNEPQSLLMGALAVGLAMWVFGWMFGIAIMLGVVIHEYGHVAAFRVCGHQDARFRLVPLFGGVAISDRLPDTQKEDLFITIMGPGICLAPMLLALGLANVLMNMGFFMTSSFLQMFAMALGLLNFFNLLPFWPLDGGRILRTIFYAFSPGFAQFMTIGMSVMFAGIGLLTQSVFLTIFALFGLQSAFTAPVVSSHQRPLTRFQATWCFIAWATCTLAFLLGAFPMIAALILPRLM